MSWPAAIPAGQVLDGVGAAMDVFPTFLRAAGGDPSACDLDGLDVLPMVAQGADTPHEQILWEMGKQTATRRGRWKLVLNGQLVEGASPEDAVHLADLDADMGESVNLAARHPDIAADLKREAEAWRESVEEAWNEKWDPQRQGLTGHHQ